MKILSLRFGENFAPECGTIQAHQNMIDENGFVWHGKFGNAVSDNIIKAIFEEKEPKLLLIKNGTPERYGLILKKLKGKLQNLNMFQNITGI